MARDSDGCQPGFGIAASIDARASAAMARGMPASLSASTQGSLPCRASAEATLSDMPLSSLPIEAKRKGSRFAFKREKRLGKAIYSLLRGSLADDSCSGAAAAHRRPGGIMYRQRRILRLAF